MFPDLTKAQWGWILAAILALGLSTATFLTVIWTGLQVVAPTITDISMVMESIPHWGIILTTAVGIVVVWRFLFPGDDLP